MVANQPLDDAIIIGIDFGTTFSGVAWAYSREPDEIEMVTSWDAEFHHCSDVKKAPTQLHYENDEKKVAWEYSVPSDKDPLKWFKLLLIDEKDLDADVSRSKQLEEARRLRTQVNKDPVDIIACFLRKIWNHSIDNIKRAVGAELLQQSRFHVVITLPAIWPPYAQHRMKRAAKMSGILDARCIGETTLRFISEPEAAALATIKDLSKRSTIQSGDTIVVCDAGGGTVVSPHLLPTNIALADVNKDLISYVIETTEPFVVKECVKGDGGLCGGVFLDENFVKLIKNKTPCGAWNLASRAQVRKFLNDEWEHGIKPQFENQDRVWPVDLPESHNNEQSRGLKRRRTIELTSAEILSVFSPVITKIEALVSRQVDAIQEKYSAPPKYIILVGGFGRSRYLFNRLQTRFTSEVLQSRGSKPWTAICRGAVVQGLIRHTPSSRFEVNIESRIARMSYGIRYRTRFIVGLHDECDKIWSEEEQEFETDNKMTWFLREGDNLMTKRSVRHDYYRLYLDEIDQVSSRIYCTSSFPPPAKCDEAVDALCTIKWNRVPGFESLPTYTNPIGKVYHKLDFTIEMTCEDGIVDFTIYYNGQRVGGHNVDVEFL
ncbi:hypothetical protein F66182_10135 [Fusarium sp. NRRL 66182]|nr:hypothetical protein F66182_10135 [Fusarium sp. NRRL 66182]